MNLGKVYVSLFALVVGTVLNYLGLGFWTFSVARSSILSGSLVEGSVLLSVPRAVVWLAGGLPVLIASEAVLFFVFSRRRWNRTPHHVGWDIIPNHNIVV